MLNRTGEFNLSGDLMGIPAPGAPLTCPGAGGEQVVAGVASWSRCGQLGYPGVYTQTSAYIDWITGILDTRDYQ